MRVCACAEGVCARMGCQSRESFNQDWKCPACVLPQEQRQRERERNATSSRRHRRLIGAQLKVHCGHCHLALSALEMGVTTAGMCSPDLAYNACPSACLWPGESCGRETTLLSLTWPLNPWKSFCFDIPDSAVPSPQ